MKERLGKTIQHLRKVQCYTQEQMADAVGVSVAAVSKWENGVSCPDVMLLPVLARYLDTDINTLLSFHKKLSKEEEAQIVNEMSDIFFGSGIEAAYAFLKEKIREYPGNDMLVLNGAMVLDGALVMNGAPDEAGRYKEAVERLYEKASESEDYAVQNGARYMLASKYLGREEYDRAKELIDGLPDEQTFDKKQMQVNLYLAQDELAEAAKLEERELMSAANSVNMAFVRLIEIAVREGREEDARYLAEAASKAAHDLDLWEYMACLPSFELYARLKDRDNCLKTFERMLASATEQWDFTSSPLYRHIDKKDGGGRLGARMKETLLAAVENDEGCAFLREAEEWEKIKSAVSGTDRGAGSDET